MKFFDKVKDTFNLGGRMGLTDYIDFLKQDEVPKNLMKGVDIYGRKFLTMKIGGIDLNNNKFFKSGQVFFERYSNDHTKIAGADFEGSFISIYGGINQDQLKLIDDLVDGKIIKVKSEHRFNSSDYNVIIANMNYWEKLAARKIQKNFIIARYNPNYNLCKKIVNRQYDEYINN